MSIQKVVNLFISSLFIEFSADIVHNFNGFESHKMSNILFGVADFQRSLERLLVPFAVHFVCQFQHLREFLRIKIFEFVFDQNIKRLPVSNLSKQDALAVNLEVTKIDVVSNVFYSMKSYSFVAQFQLNIQGSSSNDVCNSIHKRGS